MERRRAIAVAGSLTITAFAGAIAAGAGTGLFGLGTIGGAATPSASLAPVTRPAPRIVEITVPTSAPGAATNSTGRSGVPASVASIDAGSAAPVAVPAPSVQSAAQEPAREVQLQPTKEPLEHEDAHGGRESDD